jgi:ubiquinone/menaquinone biosynthesis C-methylase UbiE
MTSQFNVQNAAGYEQLMGRWSQRLARPFIEFAGVEDGEKILDVGCGTGSLTFALAEAADLSEIAAIDFSPVFVEEAIRRNVLWRGCPLLAQSGHDGLDSALKCPLLSTYK